MERLVLSAVSRSNRLAFPPSNRMTWLFLKRILSARLLIISWYTTGTRSSHSRIRATSIPRDPISRVIATNGIKPPLPHNFEPDSVDGEAGEPQLVQVSSRTARKRPDSVELMTHYARGAFHFFPPSRSSPISDTSSFSFLAKK